MPGDLVGADREPVASALKRGERALDSVEGAALVREMLCIMVEEVAIETVHALLVEGAPLDREASLEEGAGARAEQGTRLLDRERGGAPRAPR